ncbi:MAG: SCO family protein, partial [Thermoanaerobaculia bacterium]|nr:SCO family protein [Thermoanaerobaculia bacterium]
MNRKPLERPRPARRRLALVVTLVIPAAIACSAPQAREGRSGSPEPPPGLEYVPPAPGTYLLPRIRRAPDGAVVDADGSTRRLEDYLRDRYAVISFVYSRCADGTGCPLATAVLQMVEPQIVADAGLADEVRLVSLSFDPEHDTAEVMRRYVARDDDYLSVPHESRPWSLVTTGSRAELEPILEGLGQYVVRERDESGRPTG